MHTDSLPRPLRLRWTERGAGWLAGAALIGLAVLAPVLTLVWWALGGDLSHWRHLATYVLPQALANTAALLAGVGVLVTLLGTGSAWLVTAYEFPSRRTLTWALLLPLAVPTYIIAFAYLDLLHPIGPIQSAIRALLGYDSPRQFRLPDLRSIQGAIFVLGFVLYPYVYLSTRVMFMTQAASLLEAARTLGAGRYGVFFRVALPLARPAIVVGVSLALLETLNDIGASEFLGVQTLTVSVYTTWVTRSDLAGAAQIALTMLAIVIGLILLERHGRKRLHLVGGVSNQLLNGLGNTLIVAFSATIVTLLCGLIVAWAGRTLRESAGFNPGRACARVASLGYAVPGTVLAIGLLTPFVWIDTAVAKVFGGGGLFLMGSMAALVCAYAIRFLAISTGALEAGLARIPPSLEQASRLLGESSAGTLRRVHLPLLRPALAASALLVFVDAMKELPATLLLRPMNFDTLATWLYAEAARGTYEEGAVAALAIVLAGLLPVILLARTNLKMGH
ncbi:iron ABC transporter permease [Achromobacter dolens]|uniref:ABC transporter permease n=1 Tax=Achromobacter dolens TaxID=1287738 RepID=UPI0022B89701|nr:iron ABC transporter permease [Achromobacter dolens]MCZ8408879.1 iron ABC transporter permease [Achromobacter dolens]